MRPVVTRVHRHRGVCPCCRRGFGAPAPDGLAPGSPFGPGLVALILHLHVTQAIGFERLAQLLDEVFGVTISEGAIANLLARAEAPLTVAATTIAQEVRNAKAVASDETSARVGGKTWWQWVLLSSTAVYHVIAAHRSAAVVSDFLGGAIPEVWVADRYAAQAGHGAQRQVCLAHLLRDAQFAIDAGDAIFAAGFRKLLLRSIAIGQRRADLKDTTLAQYRADLDRRLDRLLAVAPTVPAGRKLGPRHRQMPRRSLCLRHSTRRSRHQQRVRTGAAAQRHLSQSHRLLPIPLGRPPLRRNRFRHRYRTPQRPFRPSGHSRYPRRPVHPCTSLSTGVSSYPEAALELTIKQFKARMCKEMNGLSSRI